MRGLAPALGDIYLKPAVGVLPVSNPGFLLPATRREGETEKQEDRSDSIHCLSVPSRSPPAKHPDAELLLLTAAKDIAAMLGEIRAHANEQRPDKYIEYSS